MEVKKTGKVPKFAPRGDEGILCEESLMLKFMNPNGWSVVYAVESCNRVYFILNKALHPVGCGRGVKCLVSEKRSTT